jgi:hypothetical protein
MRGVRVLERRTTSSLLVSAAIISLADCGVMKQRRAIAALLDSDSPIAPLLTELSFVHPGTNWGLAFRRGLIEVSEQDMRVIANAMRANAELFHVRGRARVRAVSLE